MFEGWEDYYLLVGSAAAALIGLLFVVISLLAGRERSSLEMGARFYMTPIVFDLAAILVLSGAAMAPPIHPAIYGWFAIAFGLVSCTMDIRITLGIGRLDVAAENRTFDTLWYGIIPAFVSVLFVVAGASVLLHQSWAPMAVGGVLMALLVLSIHNAWDLVTYIAPTAGPGSETATAKPKPKARNRRR
jgi:hypothetical protein